jgi:hypothetical protein
VPVPAAHWHPSDQWHQALPCAVARRKVESTVLLVLNVMQPFLLGLVHRQAAHASLRLF